MEVIFKDYKTYFIAFIIAFLVALYEVLQEAKIREKAGKMTRKLLGRIVFLKDKIKNYSSSSSSSRS